MLVNFLIFILFPLCVVFSLFMDVFTFKISNYFSLILIVGFILLAIVLQVGWSVVGYHFLAGFIALLIGFALFSFNLIGGGDAKLYAAIALWFGLESLFPFTFVMTIYGGFLAIGLVRLRGMVLPAFLQGQKWALRLLNDKGHMPYGVAIGFAALCIFPNTEIFKFAFH